MAPVVCDNAAAESLHTQQTRQINAAPRRRRICNETTCHETFPSRCNHHTRLCAGAIAGNVTTAVSAGDTSENASGPTAATPKAAAPAATSRDEGLRSVPAPAFPEAQSKLESWKDTVDTSERALRFRAISDTTLTDLRERFTFVQSDARDPDRRHIAPA